jgi:CHAT domain-containing protein
MDEGVVATTSALSSGGDILFDAPLIDVSRSTVTTNVGAGNGGNIRFTGEALALRNGSRAVAQAREGMGGRIDIETEQLLRTNDALIDASSELGIDGTVAIRSPAVDLNAALATLSSGYVDPASLLVERCQLRDREGVGSFRLGGRDALPLTPERSPAARYSSVATPADAAERGDFDAFFKSVAAAPEAAAGEALRRAEVLESLGELSRARDTIGLARERSAAPVRGPLLALQARLWARSGAWSSAEHSFAAAERLAEETGDEALLARVLLDRATAETARGNADRAAQLHARAQAAARRAGDRDTLARSLAAAPGSGPSELEAALHDLAGLAPTHDRLFTELHLGLRLAALPGDAARLRAGEVFALAAERAQALGDETAAAYAWGYLGELYTREGRRAEATELARRALAAASRAERPEAVYRFADRVGDALEREGNLPGAARTYALAVASLERLRGGAVLTARAHAELDSAFPAQDVTRKLVDVQLRQARQSAPATRSALLRQARAQLEFTSRRDIRDFFQDECLALEQSTALDEVSDALVVYPIFLDDRVELLVSSSDGIEQVAVAAPATELRGQIGVLRTLLEDRTSHDYREPAARLYDWIIGPLKPFLTGGSAGRTLVFVASGPLAGVPVGALYDRERQQFLVEQYPVAVSPGLSLIEPRALGGSEHTALQAGLTQAVGDFPPLPATAPEIEGIRQLVGGKTLLNSAFLAQSLDHELSSTPYEIVHIASHGHFGANPEDTYLLAYDGRIGMSELADLVARTRFRDKPLELLTLSACETAQGDERAALGLAGVAVRAGARSTLASLWSVNDASTARLMQGFYTALVRDGASRARALQAAQRKLLADPVYRHPVYWSPFVLVGSWR